MAARAGERTLRIARGWARVEPWRQRPDVAHVAVTTEQVLAAAAVRACVARARDAGYRAAVTSPLSDAASVPFLAAGFTPRGQLRLLAHSLGGTELGLGGPELRRGRRGDRPDVVDLDARVFSPPEALGPWGLRQALRATPAARFRVGQRPGDAALVAYAVTGRAGRQGYLQRLGVHPAARRHGFGRALVVDALRWVRRGGGQRCLVNTPVDNEQALALYEACGFRQLPSGLTVLGRAL